MSESVTLRINGVNVEFPTLTAARQFLGVPEPAPESSEQKIPSPVQKSSGWTKEKAKTLHDTVGEQQRTLILALLVHGKPMTVPELVTAEAAQAPQGIGPVYGVVNRRAKDMGCPAPIIVKKIDMENWIELDRDFAAVAKEVF